MHTKRSLIITLIALLILVGCGGKTNQLSGVEDSSFVDQYQTTAESTISIGGASAETIENTFEAHNWVFEADAGTAVLIEVDGDGLSDPRFKLYDPDLNVIAEGDDTDGSVNAEAEVTLPQTGQYILRIDMWAPGDYIVRLKPAD